MWEQSRVGSNPTLCEQQKFGIRVFFLVLGWPKADVIPMRKYLHNYDKMLARELVMLDQVEIHLVNKVTMGQNRLKTGKNEDTFYGRKLIREI